MTNHVARGPFAMEQDVLAALPDLLAKREAATDKRERKQLAVGSRRAGC